ncbi:MAG: methyltransferase [Oscillospiraceae bacterium]
MPPCVQYDDPWPGGPRFARSGAGFALGTDSVLLADFAADRRVRRFADLGCGAGVLTVLLLHALPQAAAVGVELQPDAAQLCRNNLEANGLTGRAQILCADLREHRAVLPAGSFDLVVANPPYFAAGSGYTCPTPCARTRARRAAPAPWTSALPWPIHALGRLGRARAPAGAAERAAVRSLSPPGSSPRACAPWRTRRDGGAQPVLVEARRAEPGSLLPPLALCAPDGTDSEEIRRIYHRRT